MKPQSKQTIKIKGGYETKIQTNKQNKGGHETTIQTNKQNKGGHETTIQTNKQNKGGHETTIQTNKQNKEGHDTTISTNKQNKGATLYVQKPPIKAHADVSKGARDLTFGLSLNPWLKVFRINNEFRILRMTFYRKSASKC